MINKSSSIFRLVLVLSILIGMSGLNDAYSYHSSEGCLILQTNDTRKIRIESGIIGQTMVPCSDGTLDYLTLYIESTSSEVFTAELRVLKGRELLSRQQLVIPAEGSNKSKAWIAEPPTIQAGEEYVIEIDAPEGKSFYAYYSDVNLYEEGSMRINDLLTSGDLAFEAGVRQTTSKKEFFKVRRQDECIPSQNEATDAVSANQIERQTIQFCETANLDYLTLQYTSTEEAEGMLHIYQTNDESGVSIMSVPFLVSNTLDMSPLLITLDPTVSLEAETSYDLTFTTASGDALPETFMLFHSITDNYAGGELITTDNTPNRDLAFSIQMVPAGDQTEEQQHERFDGFPNHECTIGQVNAQQQHSFGAGIITVDIKVCDDGELEAIYFKGKQVLNDNSIVFNLKDGRNNIIKNGTLTETDGHQESLMADLESTPVNYYATYRLELIIPEGSELQLESSNDPKHVHFDCTVNGEDFPEHLVMVNAMKPYEFEFEEASEDKGAISMVAYPNPFISTFNLEIEGLKVGTAMVSLYDFQGNKVFESEIEGADETIELSVSPEMALMRGYYTLRIDYDNQVILETIMKQ
ncbi:MAG: T9SS type A sorting domain-containing protein [Flavobacteriales bacterium]|nr:T9SS type A sorting domain-containing protein [Flavobacteriales bacterium]MDG2247184.1 T9SS type A sorting domain-containing protein [Flavobacteriales bacterium]